MRAGVAGLPSAHSLADGLPAAFLANAFTREFVRAFDDVLAPVIASIDDFDAYLHPGYAPPDFLPWLIGWFGVPVDPRTPPEALRGRIMHAVRALRWRGTRLGVTSAVRCYAGVTPEVLDSGGVVTSPRPSGPLPGDPRPGLLVRVPDPYGALDAGLLAEVIGGVTPAHVPVRVQLVPAAPSVPAAPRVGPGPGSPPVGGPEPAGPRP
jgi:phage tail-like protein